MDFTQSDDIQNEKLYKTVIGEKNQDYYLTKFEKFDQQSSELKEGWNWPAFFFTNIWALYRKMYGWFFGLCGIYLLFSLLYYYRAPAEIFISYVLIHIIFAIYANSLYHRNIQKKIAVARFSIKDDSKLLKFLKHKGGVHGWVVWLFIALPAAGFFAAILIPMAEHYMTQSQSTPKNNDLQVQKKDPVTDRAVQLPQSGLSDTENKTHLTEKRYTGEKISVDFASTDIRNALRIFEQVSGMNFFINDNIACKINYQTQKPMPWDQILDKVLSKHGLSASREENSITITKKPPTTKSQKKLERHTLQERIDKDPEDYNAYLLLARKYHKSKEHEKSLKTLKTLLQINPSHTEGHLLLGLTYLIVGNKYKAFEQCQILQNLNATDKYHKILNIIVDGKTVFEYKYRDGTSCFSSTLPDKIELDEVAIISAHRF